MSIILKGLGGNQIILHGIGESSEGAAQPVIALVARVGEDGTLRYDYPTYATGEQELATLITLVVRLAEDGVLSYNDPIYAAEIQAAAEEELRRSRRRKHYEYQRWEQQQRIQRDDEEIMQIVAALMGEINGVLV